jgi:hypothetical protein
MTRWQDDFKEKSFAQITFSNNPGALSLLRAEQK